MSQITELQEILEEPPPKKKKTNLYECLFHGLLVWIRMV